MNANKALWEKGDFTRIAESMRESGEALVGKLGITEGLAGPGPRMRRRDDRVAGGTARAPTCSGVDIAANLVAAGNARAAGASAWHNSASRRAMRRICNELEDERFDLVVSIFGAMFAPKPVRRGQGDGPGDAGPAAGS